MQSLIHEPSFDPLGKVLLDYYNGDHSAKVTVKSSMFSDDEITGKYLFRSLQEMPHIERRALELCHGSILDVGAGSGCHSLALQRLGFQTTAVEISPLAIDVMYLRGIKHTIHNSFFNLEKHHYDTLLFLMNGVGICGTLSKLKDFIRKCKELLAPKGKVILESSDLKYLYQNDDGSISLDLNSAYYGEIDFQMEYKGTLGEKFNWLYVDFETLYHVANHNGMRAELAFHGENNSYLAVLREK